MTQSIFASQKALLIMLTIKECRKHLKEYNLSDERVEEIRDYLTALSKNIIRDTIKDYEHDIAKTNRGEQDKRQKGRGKNQ